MKKYTLVPGIILFSFFIFIAACSKKNDDNATPAPAPPQDNIVVSNFSPTSGPYSTIVTINGSGFNTTAASNTVKFNGKTATVQSATATQLVVVVPEAAGIGPVTVAWGSQSGTGAVFNFVYVITVSTFCGSGTGGFANGSAATSQFSNPIDVKLDKLGNVYVADYNNQRIRMITPAGVSSTFAGSGSAGNADGNGSTAQFYYPVGLTFDGNGNLYVADQTNTRIRKITPAAVVSTLAGSSSGFADGNGSSAQFYFPTGIAIDATGNVFIGDQGNNRIRKITPSGVVSTFAGSGVSGFADGAPTVATFSYPTGVAFDASNNLIVCDNSNNSIRKVTSAGVVSTLAGTGTLGVVNGPAATATFNDPFGLAVAADGTIYIADRNNHAIRMISTSGQVTTLAGSTSGYADGSGSSAKFSNPSGIGIAANGDLYVADLSNHRIRKITIQ